MKEDKPFIACASLLRKDTAIYFLLSALSLLYVIKLLIIANVKYYPTIYRVTYIHFFNEPITGSSFTDNMIIIGLSIAFISLVLKHRFAVIGSISIFIIGLASGMLNYGIFAEAFAIATIPSIIALILIDRFYRKMISITLHLDRFLITTFIIILIFEGLALLRWISYPIFPSKLYEDWSWSIARLEMRLFYIFGLLSPLVMLLTTYAFLIKPYINDIRVLITNRVSINTNFTFKESPIFSRRSLHKWLLLSSFALSIIFAIYPYLPTVNPDFKGASVDIVYYVNWVNQLKDSNNILYEAFIDISKGDRPLSLLLIFVIHSLTDLPLDIIVRFLPLLLGPMLVAAVYYFTKVGTDNKDVAALAALLTVVSYHSIIGIYAGFFANWLALVTSYLSFILLLKALERSDKLYYLGFLSLTIITLFIHVYTWSYLIASLILFLIISYLLHRREHDKIIKIGMLSLIIGVNIAVDLVKVNYFGSAGGIERDLSIAENWVGLDQFLLRWNNLQYTFNTYVGGYYTNIVILILAFIWVLKARYNNNFDRVLLASIFVGAIPIIVGNFGMQTRMFYNMPIHIPAALMLYNITNSYKLHPMLRSVAFLTIIVYLLNYGFRAMANLYLILP